MIVGAYVLADGSFADAATTRFRHASDLWWIALLEGICGVLFGAIALSAPTLTVLAFILILGAWSLITGVIELTVAEQMRWATGEFTAFLPIGLLLTWMVGLHAFFSGLLLLQLAIWLHFGPHNSPMVTTSADAANPQTS